MAPRQQLQSLLETITDHVYFQPPTNIRLTYPCIVYTRQVGADSKFADNTTYRFTQRYSVTVIDRDPDSNIPGQIAVLPMCTYDRYYAVDGLNHDVFDLFF